MKNKVKNLKDYDVVFVGYPIWHGDLPMAVYTFFDIRIFNEEYFGKLLTNIFSFSHYAWYVNLYIGLYLLIPFLNAGFNSLTSR